MGKHKEIELGRIPPSDPLFEEDLLGHMITFQQNIPRITAIIRSEYFYKPEHGIIFDAIVDMHEKEIAIDLTTLSHYLRTIDKLEEVGGSYYISTLCLNSGPANYDYHAQVILSMYIRRDLIYLFSENTIKLYELNSDIIDITNIVFERLELHISTLNASDIQTINKAIDNAINELKTIQSNPDLFYIKTGDNLIDNHVYLSSGMIVCIASPRSAGKTSYLIRLMKGIHSLNKDIATLWFSFEDKDVKILRSFATMDSGIKLDKMMGKGEKLSDKELDIVIGLFNSYEQYNIEFECESQLIRDIRSRCYAFAKKNKNKTIVICIDNIMLIKDLLDAGNNNTTPIEDKIAGIIRNIITRIEKQGNKVLLFYLHHMTKEMEARINIDDGYRPKLSYMKGSTRLADVPNAVILLNKIGAHKDLIKMHSQLPDIKCINSNGSIQVVSRKKLLENMIIGEIAKNRDGEMADDNSAIERYIVDHKIMKYQPLKCIK